MMSLFSNSTYQSPKKEGDPYAVNFEDSSWRKGRRKKVYVGIARGKGPLNGEKVCVKIRRTGGWTNCECDSEVEKCKTARELALEFNQQDLHKTRINILVPHRAKVCDTALFHKMKHRERSLSEGDWVTFETKINKNFKALVKRNGQMVHDVNFLINTFVHFSYHATEGRCVVCGLQGVMSRDTNELQISGPTIHSTDESFGELDQGHQGICDVFKHHTCNEICEKWMIPKLSDEVKDEDTRLKDSQDQRCEPSAPPDPEIFQMDDINQHEIKSQFCNSRTRAFFNDTFYDTTRCPHCQVTWYNDVISPPPYSELPLSCSLPTPDCVPGKLYISCQDDTESCTFIPWNWGKSLSKPL